ncbi:MAG: pentapeptide repeat-containing protein [Anaerolineales bacterium]|nr:pentapeptide repeat-containing protein [Anaerolineales bacterium]
MTVDVIQTIAGYIAIAVPVTVALGNLARIILEWLNQRHKIKTTVIQQTHNITTHYLDRALDPQVPLAFRHQLLRFLATPDRDGSRLQTWAQNELERVGSIVDEANRAVEAAEKELQAAKSAAQIEAAERKLAEAMQRQKSLMEPPAKPPLTAASLRAGFIYEEELSGLEMRDADLNRMSLTYRNLRGADFSGSDLTGATLQGSDLRAASFIGTKLDGTVFYRADLRGAILREAILKNTNFQEAHLEGADLSSAKIEGADLRATYDQTTKWPAGFDPDAAGAVQINVPETANVPQSE